jgi:hypothetical protein
MKATVTTAIVLSTVIAMISHKIVKIVFMQEMLTAPIVVVTRYRITVMMEIARIIAMLHNVFKIIVIVIVIVNVNVVNNLMKRII